METELAFILEKTLSAIRYLSEQKRNDKIWRKNFTPKRRDIEKKMEILNTELDNKKYYFEAIEHLQWQF